MFDRRKVLVAAGGWAMAGGISAAQSVLHRTKDVWGEDDVPAAKTVRGHPNILDFGDGLKVPLDKHAFLTLWEGKTFWMTYGVGSAERAYQASGKAISAAEGTMKLLLMTLAFAPERLEQIDGGWRLKVQDMKNYVRGDIVLPGKPFSPLTDPRFGNMDTANPGAAMAAASIGQSSGQMAPILPPNLLGGDNKALTFTCYIVKKKDVDLDYVRKFAQVVSNAN